MSTPTPPLYDVNFCFPVRELENDRVKLTPFIPAQHADLFFQGSSSHPELYQHLPPGPFPSATTFTEDYVHVHIQPNTGNIFYAIIDKTRTSRMDDGTNVPPTDIDFAGIIGYIHGSPTHLSVEIGCIIVLPPFQRTHVTTDAVGLLLRYALDLPTATPPGLGLRRVQWQTSEKNEASIRVAERMGFKREARLIDGDPRAGTLGRHTVVFAICWDDWENGGREQVARLMDR
ncbi:acyl-CoA N-acyltransferase [Boletus edulis BED1]|uniref:Acyl-CoA N-acyltransferase n=1 Tax=Boletus edulis BED1 TaxID=1328754 RepID=A0AAD4GC39_BOLED|nr:acyl-CoA N-acyltransferase [Boletus edulis BED1]